MNTTAPLELDVREELKKGGEPFSRIMATTSKLAPGQALLLRATFEPVPLYAVLGSKGYDHSAKKIADDDWEVLFTPKASAA